MATSKDNTVVKQVTLKNTKIIKDCEFIVWKDINNITLYKNDFDTDVETVPSKKYYLQDNYLTDTVEIPFVR